MAVTFPISLPSGNRLALSFRPYSVVGMSMSPFTLQQQAQAHQGQIWVVRMQLLPLTREEAEEWIGALLSLNGRYGTFLLGDESATSPRGSMATGAITGPLTQANTSLCFETGKAFVDLAGVDLSAQIGKRIIITDSGGKTATGWLKAAGTTVTYGSDLITNGGFDSDTTGWTEDVGSIASVAGGQAGNGLEVTSAGGEAGVGDVPQVSGDVPFQSGDVPWAGAAGGSVEQPIVTQTIAGQPSGRLYRIAGGVKSGTAGAGTARLGFTHSGGAPTTRSEDLVTSDLWHFIILDHVTAPTAGAVLSAVWLQDAGTNPGTMLFDTITLHQILTPSATGATIVSAEDGNTFEWETEEAGFNRDDPNGYTYTLPNASGNAYVNGANQTGQELATDGWLPNSTGVLKRGDWIQLGSGTTQRIYRVMADVNSDAAGKATIDIWPRLRESPADDEPLVVTNTMGVFRLTHNDMPWEIDNNLLYGIELEAAEAL